MKILNQTFNTPQKNLACDEALLDAAEEGLSGEVLRFWSPQNTFVVLGYSNKISEDVNLAACQKSKIPVLRRVSGGGTVLQGPGCLNYSLILEIQRHPGLASITSTNYFIMDRHRQALQPLTSTEITVRGITDLACGNLKFSGNAQRRKRHFVLFHGTFLLSFDLETVEKFLTIPPRQPDYRKNRKHGEFLMNLGLPEGSIKEALVKNWGAEGTMDFSFSEKMQGLIEASYSREAWNFKF